MDKENKITTVLLVDDDNSNLLSIKEYLEDIHDFIVSEYTNSDDAFQILKKNPKDFSVFLIDWTLKPLSGEELLERARKIAPDMPVIVFTANAEAGAVAYSKGAYAYFRKPVDPEELTQTIKEAVSQDNSSSDHFFELINISSLLLEQQTLEGFAEAIVTKAVDLLDATAGCFYLWNWAKKDFVVLAQTDCGEPTEKHRPVKHILAKFLRAKTSILVYSDSIKMIPSDLMVENFSSQAFVLLQRTDITLGLLVIGKQSGEFSDEDEVTLRSLQTLLEPLLEQVKVKEELQKVDQHHITNEKDLGELVVSSIFELLGKPTGLWLSDRGYSRVKLETEAGIFKKHQSKKSILSKITHHLAVSSLSKKETVLWQSSDALPVGIPSVDVDEFDYRSILIIPLLTFENDPIGAITVYADQPHAFKEYDKYLVKRFTTRLSSMLDNYREQDQAERLASLSEQLAKGKNEEEIFNVFAKEIYNLMGARNVVIYPYDPVKQVFYNREHIVLEGIIKRKKKVDNTPRVKGLAAIVRYVEKIVVQDTYGGIDAIQVESLETIPEENKITKSFLCKIIKGERFIEREEIRAFVGISLRKSHTQAEVGVMYVNFQAPRNFTESEINALQIAVRQVASAVHTQRVLKQQEVTSKALGEIIDSIVGTTDPLEIILGKIAPLFSADYGSISRLKEDGRHLEFKALWEKEKI